MKEYETVWEIFNECANNQMRDVFIDEICTDDPEKFVLDRFQISVNIYLCRIPEVIMSNTMLPSGRTLFSQLTSFPLNLSIRNSFVDLCRW